MEFGDGFVEVGLRLEFASAGGDQVGLALGNEIKCRRSGAELTLFAFKKLFGGSSRGDCGIKARFGGTERLQGVSDLRFDDLFGLRSLIFDAVAFGKRSAEIRFSDVVSPRQRDRDSGAKCRIICAARFPRELK